MVKSSVSQIWRTIFVLGILVSLILVPSQGSAAPGEQSSTLNAAADTYLRQGSPNTNEGASPIMRVWASGDNRTLIRFDQSAIASTIGGGVLVSAKLQVDIAKNANNWGKEGRTVGVHRLSMAWAEGNGKDAELPPKQSFRGSGSGATWNLAIDTDISNRKPDGTPENNWEMRLKKKGPNNPPWQDPATASLLITKDMTGTLEFDVTADVAAFLSGTPNYGWIIKKTLENKPGHLDLASRENSSQPGPRLVLTYIRDTTPPVITPHISGTLGNNGWYVSDVTVTWTVEDPESGIASSSGAGPTTINTDTAGTTLNASATNGTGLTSSASVTIKRDATPPSITGSGSPPPNVNGWDNGPVTVSFSATDATSGVASVSGPMTVSGEGANQKVTGTATDNAGNNSFFDVFVNIDLTPPAVTITRPANGERILIGTAVAASYSGSDALSGIDSVVGTAANVANIDTGSAGTKTFTVTATDKAGNTASQSVTYEVYDTIALSSPLRDAYLRGGAQNYNEGGNTGLRIQGSGDNRVLVAFDLSGLPTSLVTSATLILNAYEQSGPHGFETSGWGTSGKPINAYRLLTNLTDWAEGNGFDGDYSNSVDFRGNIPGATWNTPNDPDTTNGNPDGGIDWNGGDGKPASAPDWYSEATGPDVTITNDRLGDVSFDVTLDVRAGAEHGWLIKKVAGGSGQIHFRSKENGAGPAPRLILTFGP